MITAEKRPRCDLCCINGGTMFTVSDSTCVCSFLFLQENFELAPPYGDYTRRVCDVV